MEKRQRTGAVQDAGALAMTIAFRESNSNVRVCADKCAYLRLFALNGKKIAESAPIRVPNQNGRWGRRHAIPPHYDRLEDDGLLTDEHDQQASRQQNQRKDAGSLSFNE